jgi:hypothetical protein
MISKGDAAAEHGNGGKLRSDAHEKPLGREHDENRAMAPPGHHGLFVPLRGM